jgi:DNA-directed RNA polymerase specialized sigma24 family protein
MKTINDNEEAILGRIHEDGDTQRQDATDALVTRAMQGDRRALGAIATHFGPMLLEEARIALKGTGGAEDVVQDFYLCVLEHEAQFTRADGGGAEWLRRTVRQMAVRRRKGRRTHRHGRRT